MLPAIVIFLAALAFALWAGRVGPRALVALAVVLAPLRGGMLTAGTDIGLADPGLTVNAIVPAIVAAAALGALWQRRPGRADLAGPLAIGWGLIALTALLSFPFAVVGLKLYGIGVAQYLVYPTLALTIWLLIEPGDGRRLTRLMIAMATVVAGTVLLQAAGIEGFIQAASAHVEGLGANRYAGVTGSYLHTSAFLGTCGVLMMGELPHLRSLKERVAGVAVLALILSGVMLTFSRSGVVIAMLGALALFLFAVQGARLRFAALVVPALAIAVAAASIGGVSPTAAGERVASGFSPTKDAGNQLRTESFDNGLEVFADSSLGQQAIGRGAASTGNAQQLVVDSAPKVTVESYYLKLLCETGIVGLILVGGFLIWVAVSFGLGILRRPGPWATSVASAGLGLSLYNAIYPALETQILASTWWVLTAVWLCVRFERAPESAASEAEATSRSRGEKAPLPVG